MQPILPGDLARKPYCNRRLRRRRPNHGVTSRLSLSFLPPRHETARRTANAAFRICLGRHHLGSFGTIENFPKGTSPLEDNRRAMCQNRGAGIAISRLRQIKVVRCGGVSSLKEVWLAADGIKRSYHRGYPPFTFKNVRPLPGLSENVASLWQILPIVPPLTARLITSACRSGAAKVIRS